MSRKNKGMAFLILAGLVLYSAYQASKEEFRPDNLTLDHLQDWLSQGLVS